MRIRLSERGQHFLMQITEDRTEALKFLASIEQKMDFKNSNDELLLILSLILLLLFIISLF